MISSYIGLLVDKTKDKGRLAVSPGLLLLMVSVQGMVQEIPCTERQQIEHILVAFYILHLFQLIPVIFTKLGEALEQYNEQSPTKHPLPGQPSLPSTTQQTSKCCSTAGRKRQGRCSSSNQTKHVLVHNSFNQRSRKQMRAIKQEPINYCKLKQSY